MALHWGYSKCKDSRELGSRKDWLKWVTREMDNTVWKYKQEVKRNGTLETPVR